MGRSPPLTAETAMPARVWVWITQAASCRAMWTAEWIVKPAGFTRAGASPTLLPSTSILTSDEAVISSQRWP